MAGTKRTHDGNPTAMKPQSNTDAIQVEPEASSPYIPMFEVFRAELDEHHDRRERVMKASKDITAKSKKM